MRPPYLPTAAAARFASTTKWGLLRAYWDGEIEPAGRRGKSFVWKTSDLERWAMGEPIASPANVSDRTPQRRSTPREIEPERGAALARLRLIARGQR